MFKGCFQSITFKYVKKFEMARCIFFLSPTSNIVTGSLNYKLCHNAKRALRLDEDWTWLMLNRRVVNMLLLPHTVCRGQCSA